MEIRRRYWPLDVRSQGREESIFGLWVNDYVCGMNKSRVAAATFAHTTLSSGKRRALVVTLPGMEEFHAGSTCSEESSCSCNRSKIPQIVKFARSPRFLHQSYVCSRGLYGPAFCAHFHGSRRTCRSLGQRSIALSRSLVDTFLLFFRKRRLGPIRPRGDGVCVNFQRRQFDLEIYLRGFRFLSTILIRLLRIFSYKLINIRLFECLYIYIHWVIDRMCAIEYHALTWYLRSSALQLL